MGQLTGDISEGILPRWLHQHLPLGHHGFVCPFCGGGRSFVYFCRLDFSGALHSSILGTLGAVYMVLTLPLRIICCRCKPGSCVFSFYRMLDRFESCDVFLMITAGCFLFQLALHYAGFIWFPAAAV